MFNNIGPYGPNDTPATVGAPMNLTYINGVNLVNNLSKVVEETAQSPSGHYNLPNYTSYRPPALNMRPPIEQFSGYQQMNFQPNFLPQNSSSSQSMPWHSSVPSMNLNQQYCRDTSMLNFHHNVHKTHPQPVSSSETLKKDISLNIPQIQTKNLHKYVLNNDGNNLKEHSEHIDTNINVKNERSQLDDTRRRSLENTVKLIENILINSSKKPKDLSTNTTLSEHMKIKDTDPLSINTENNVNKINNKIDNATTKNSIETENTEEAVPSNLQSSISNGNSTKASINNHNTEVKEITIEISPHKLEEILGDSIEIKIEPSDWTDKSNFTPFHKDINSVTRDDAPDCMFVDARTSVKEAGRAIKNGMTKLVQYECPYCGLLFIHPKRFLIHVKWHSFGASNNRQTELARKREQRRNQRRAAKEAQKAELKIKEEPNEFACKQCDKVFNSNTNLRKHRYRTHSTRACKTCHKQIDGWAAWQEHMSSCIPAAVPIPLGDLWYQCSDCPKKYKYPHTLAKHRDTHLEKTHGCEECPKKFGSQKLLRVHMKTHERAQRGARFSCSYCGKGYMEAYTLQVHERSHTNERPFSCETCKSKFVSNSGLQRHLKVSHSTSKPFECPVCHRSFATEPIRDNHVLRAHGSPEDFAYVCKECPSRFSKSKHLRKHTYKAHPKGKSKKKEKSESE